MWKYEHTEGNSFEPISAGPHRVRIESAEKAVSKTGKDMLKIVMEVSGCKSKLFHNIVFLPDRPEITNRNLTDFYAAFAQIKEGDFNLAGWVGKMGAVQVKHEPYNGEMQARVHYFIPAGKQLALPVWVEPEKSESTGSGSTVDVQTDDNGFMQIPEGVAESLPF